MRSYIGVYDGKVIRVDPGGQSDNDCSICVFGIACSTLADSCNDTISRYLGINSELLDENDSDHVARYCMSLYISRYYKIHEQANTIL